MLTRLQPWFLIVLGGVLLPISFCGFDQWYLTWIAFVPLLGALEGATRRQAIWRGFVFGLIANMIGYYWIPQTIHEFGRFPAYLAWTFGVILCSYQGIQYSLLAYLTVRLRERSYSLLWVFPTVMVALETVYPLLFPIFMGNTQHVIPLLIQTADLLGPLLITAVILTFNVSLYLLLRPLLMGEHKKKGFKPPWKQVVVGPIGLVLLVVYGAIRIPVVDAATQEGTELRVGVVQPSMGILEKWRDVEEGARRHSTRSIELQERGADLIIWSEAAYTAGYIRPDRQTNIRELLVPELHTPLLVGALTLYTGEGRARRRHNSALMLDAEGNIEGIYDKTYLLAFGEYLPFGNVFPQLYAASPNTGRLQPGTRFEAVPLEHEGRRWDLGVLICYEDILPRFTRELVRRASPHLLVNMTNDAWFGDSNEPWIHMDLARFRAVEHRRYLVRATNTGVSAIIDPVGRITENTEVFVQESMLSNVRLLDGGPTLYAMVGDILGYIALLLLLFGVVQTRRVWLRRPGDANAARRAGIAQPGRVLLVVAIFDVLSFVFVFLTRPAGWTPSALESLLWFTSYVTMISAFVLLRRRDARGLTLAYAAVGARLALSAMLIATTTSEHLGSVTALVGLPMALALCAVITLWLWRERCEVEDEESDKKSKKKKRVKTDQSDDAKKSETDDESDSKSASDADDEDEDEESERRDNEKRKPGTRGNRNARRKGKSRKKKRST